ncbi:hypothetical protein GE061_015449 [Apolygus lucorum]|uniref:Uncharacterized protein n=1 Tax=Apolygus lucorum TaxID=248454 RepID=A0A8S9XL02_APOLU|nr:hypothetical protein GE061_015449 [Apolygus lucorum]
MDRLKLFRAKYAKTFDAQLEKFCAAAQVFESSWSTSPLELLICLRHLEDTGERLFEIELKIQDELISTGVTQDAFLAECATEERYRRKIAECRCRYEHLTEPNSQQPTVLWDQLHALEALEVKTDQHAPLLCPLIESAQSYDVLEAWERTRDSEKEDNRVIRDELMNFMKAEVKSEERISSSIQSFVAENKNDDDIPTAATLVSGTSSKRPPEQGTPKSLPTSNNPVFKPEQEDNQQNTPTCAQINIQTKFI